MKYVGLYDNNKDIVTKEKLDAVEAAIPTKVSELTNDANYITAAQAPVQSVNNKTGAVSLTASDVGAISSTLTGTAGQVLTKTADGQEWKDAPVDDETVLLKSVSAAMPVVADWQSVCYGNGKFVAVASNSNTAAYSTDGINWTQTTLPDSIFWYSLCYGNGKFVAVAYNSNTAAYSTDGINWTQSTMPASASWQSVFYGNDKFVAVANDSKTFAYSTDGINWSSTTKVLQYPDGTDIHEQVKEALQLPEIPPLPTATKITLTVAGWNSAAKTQSVTVSGVSADATKQEIRVMPVNAALDSPYITAGVQCIAQAANSLTFGCETVPTEAIEVYVVMQGVNYSA